MIQCCGVETPREDSMPIAAYTYLFSGLQSTSLLLELARLSGVLGPRAIHRKISYARKSHNGHLGRFRHQKIPYASKKILNGPQYCVAYLPLNQEVQPS